MELRLGKKPATHDLRDLLFADYKTGALKEAPVGFGHLKLVKNPWGILLNDRLGDCAIAGPMHETMLLAAEGGHGVFFTDQDAEAVYSAACGYDPDDPSTDQGCAVRDVLAYRAATGLTDAAGANHRIGAYVAVESGNWGALLEALNTFECVGIGIQVPQSAMDQFQNGEPWTVVEGSQIVGGHYVPVVARPHEEIVDVVTWGAVQEMTAKFYKTYADEAWAYISTDALTASGKTLEGFDLAALQEDLNAL